MFTRGYLTCKHHQEVFGDLNEDTALKPAKSSWSWSSHFFLVGGIPTPLKNMKVSWDEYSNIWENKSHVPNHQPVFVQWQQEPF
jgi:hypothetical protein